MPEQTSNAAQPGQPDDPPRIPDHELLRKIGEGSYGEVWLARSTLGTYRAVKIVHRPALGSERPYEREFTGLKNFEPISRGHEGVVDVLQVGRNEDAGYFYYVMELADDGSEVRSEKYEGRSPGEKAKDQPASNIRYLES